MSDLTTTFVDLPSTTTPIDAAYLNTVSAALRVERSDHVADRLLTKMDQASSSAVIVVLGDSTGVPGGGGAWVVDVAPLIGARWLTHKVTMRLWGGTSYGSVSTVANASASLTLDIYNGSVSGTKADYPVSRIGAMLPAQPDLVIINYGHNNAADSPSTFEAGVDALVSAVRGSWPDAPIAVTSQNPRFSPAPNIVEHAAREQAKRAWTADREYGYIPAWEAFQSQSSPSSWVESDGIHPTATGSTDGSALWAKVVDSYLASYTRRPAAPSGSASLTVQDENGNVATSVTQIDFQGAGVTASAGTGEVVVTIPGGGTGVAKELLMQDGVTAPPVPLENEARSDWLYQD